MRCTSPRRSRSHSGFSSLPRSYPLPSYWVLSIQPSRVCPALYFTFRTFMLMGPQRPRAPFPASPSVCLSSLRISRTHTGYPLYASSARCSCSLSASGSSTYLRCTLGARTAFSKSSSETAFSISWCKTCSFRVVFRTDELPVIQYFHCVRHQCDHLVRVSRELLLSSRLALTSTHSPAGNLD